VNSINPRLTLSRMILMSQNKQDLPIPTDKNKLYEMKDFYEIRV